MSHLEQRLKALESERRPNEPSFLATDEWRLIRSILLEQSERYPDTKEAIVQAIADLERRGYASAQLVQDTIVGTLPWSDVRWSVAESLWKVGHPD